MSNVIQFSITGDTNAEQVAGRAKTAVSGLDKQLDGVSRKFGSGFKDIFLSFLGPMALLSAAMAFIGKMIADNQRKHEEANQAAIDGTNKLMSAEDKYWANKKNNEKKAKETAEEAKTARESVTLSFLQTDPRGQEMVNKILSALPPGMRASAAFNTANTMSLQKDVQDKVQAIIAEDAKKNPIAMAGKDTTFQGPQGFSNVIGVGANPVLENLTRQTDIQQAILDFIRTPGARTGETDIDFTKNPVDTSTTA